MYNDFVEPHIGNMSLVEVRPAHIASRLSAVSVMKNGRARKPESLSKIYGLLHKMFSDAIEHFNLLTTNPVQRKFRPKIIRKERAFLTPEQSWRLLLHTKNHWAGPAIWIQLLGALRIGEVQALRVSSIKFEEGYILISATYCRKTGIIKDNPKQGDWARVPLAPELAAYLKEILIDKKPDDFVCPAPNGGMMTHAGFIKTLKRLCEQAGVPKITPHELRHSATELYVTAGASAEDIRRLLNHSSVSTTTRYIHRTDDRLKRIAAQLKPTPA